MTGPFSIDREIDGPDLTVTVTMTAAVDRLLDLLTSDNGVRANVALIMGLPASSLSHQLARKALAASQALRAAVTETLDERGAVRLSHEMDDAASVPSCTRTHCPNLAIDRGLCGVHMDDTWPGAA